jgi:hypothetical protein
MLAIPINSQFTMPTTAKIANCFEQSIIISCAGIDIFKDKLQPKTIENLLLSHFTIQKYSDFVACYAFVLVVMPDSDNMHNKMWGHFLSKKDKTIYHSLKLNYHKFEKATETEALTMQAEAYLEGILQIPTLRGMKKVAFDSQKFYDDCKMLFENVGWIRKEL